VCITTTEELASGSDDTDRAVEQRDEKTVNLVRRARAGDSEAFEALVYSHEQMVLRTALRLLRHPHMAQDAAQETFLRLFRYLDRFDENRPLGPWLYWATLATPCSSSWVPQSSTEGVAPASAGRGRTGSRPVLRVYGHARA
jgi:hypothetical protein